MRAKVVVENEQNYENWLEEQETFSSLIAKQKKIEFKTTKIAKNDN
jgi:heme/copper-type cytochrome/quinol oxidase subunit 2